MKYSLFIFMFLLTLILSLLLFKIKNISKNILLAEANVLSNNIFCSDNDYIDGLCSISSDDNIDIPEFTGTNINDEMLFCVYMVSKIINQYKPIKLKSELKLRNGLEIIKELKVNSNKYPIFGYIAKDNNNNFYIIFRGTMDKNDITTDIDYKQTTLDNLNDIKVHEGFYNRYMLLEQDILRTLNNNIGNINNIILSGHSLGSAIATICAYKIKKNINIDCNKIYAYLFASPRVGNTNFCEDYNNNIPKTYRIVNISDIIPTLPPPISPNFEIPSKPYFFEHVGLIKNVIYFDNNWKSVLNNHLIYNYRNYIENIKKSS